MGRPSEEELRAIEESGPLLRFAAEKVHGLDAQFGQQIADAREASEAGTWTPAIAQEFWSAFAKLCDAIRPVTMDCIAMSKPVITHHSFLTPWQSRKISIAERTSGRYYAIIFILLMIIIPLQLYIWACSNLIKQLDDGAAYVQNLITSGHESFTTLSLDTSSTDNTPPLIQAGRTQEGVCVPGNCRSHRKRVNEAFREGKPVAFNNNAKFSGRQDNRHQTLIERGK